jgi:ubiquinone/menaquinone biosynthesis C-methylase UbiE
VLKRILRIFLKFIFDQLYHGMAFLYDLIADIVSLGRWKDWVFSVIPEFSDEPVVELGHGPGHLQKRMLQAGRPVYGLDESRQMSAQARKRLQGLPFQLMRADARRLPFAAASISTFVATFPSEYIFQPDTITELSRTLSPGGKIVILLAAYPGGSSFLEKASRQLFRITSESPPENGDYSSLTKQLEKNNLHYEILTRECGNTSLLVVFLRKSPQN